MRSWNDYVKDGTIRKTMPNKGRIKTLINMANVRIDVISKIKIDEQNASVIFTNNNFLQFLPALSIITDMGTITNKTPPSSICESAKLIKLLSLSSDFPRFQILWE